MITPKGVTLKGVMDFTRIDSPFDPPQNPDLEIKTDVLSIKESVELIMERVIKRIKF